MGGHCREFPNGHTLEAPQAGLRITYEMQEDAHHSLEAPQAGLRITPTDRIAMAALAGQQKKTESATCIEYCIITAGQKACRLALAEPSTAS